MSQPSQKQLRYLLRQFTYFSNQLDCFDVFQFLEMKILNFFYPRKKLPNKKI